MTNKLVNAHENTTEPVLDGSDSNHMAAIDSALIAPIGIMRHWYCLEDVNYVCTCNRSRFSGGHEGVNNCLSHLGIPTESGGSIPVVGRTTPTKHQERRDAGYWTSLTKGRATSCVPKNRSFGGRSCHVLKILCADGKEWHKVLHGLSNRAITAKEPRPLFRFLAKK